MFSTPPAPGSRNIAATALRGAGLMDHDQRMRDISDKPGGRKGSSKIRSHRQRPIDDYKGNAAGPSRTSMGLRANLASDPRSSFCQNTALTLSFITLPPSSYSKLAARISPSETLSIRGAARPTAVGRIRRNAISINSRNSVTQSTPTANVKITDHWRELVRKRYNQESQFLDLGRLFEDELVQKYNLLPPGTTGSSYREAATIFKLAYQLKPPVQTISLANNNIRSGKHLAALGHYLPKLANLSLQNNHLQSISDIDFLVYRKGKLDHLRELVLTGNPIKGTDSTNTEQYRRDILKRFPGLEILDGEPIAKLSFDAPQSSSTAPVKRKPTPNTFPCPMASSFVSGVDPVVVSNFLLRFFTLFDAQRMELIDVYHPSATFSFSANTSIPPRARIQGLHSILPNQKKLEWSPWLTGTGGGSRNLSRVGDVDLMAKSLHVGRDDVMKSISGLPVTKHDIAAAPETFCLDAWLTGSSLFVTVHGQFTEEPVHGLRSFDRSFILAPASEGSSAKALGWDVEILSDQLTVRGYSSCEAWQQGPMVVVPGPSWVSQTTQPPSSAQGSDALRAELGSIPEPERTLVSQLCQQTGLNVKFAVECLQQNGWNQERAIANFEQVKGSLSRDAFL